MLGQPAVCSETKPCPEGLWCQDNQCTEVFPPLCSSEDSFISHIYSEQCYNHSSGTSKCTCAYGAKLTIEGLIVPAWSTQVVSNGLSYFCPGAWTKDDGGSHFGKAVYTCDRSN
jgi:hypothetical protein